MSPKQKPSGKKDPAEAALREGVDELERHPLFKPLIHACGIIRRKEQSICPSDGWAITMSDGDIHVHPTRRANSREWMYILAHSLLHLAFGHFKNKEHQFEWNIACCAYVAKFLLDLKMGKAPESMHLWDELPGQDEEAIYIRFCEGGIPPLFSRMGTGGSAQMDMLIREGKMRYRGWGRRQNSFEAIFADALKDAVTSAVNVAGGAAAQLGTKITVKSIPQRARSWFISSYPLLGALAASFTLIEDAAVC